MSRFEFDYSATSAFVSPTKSQLNLNQNQNQFPSHYQPQPHPLGHFPPPLTHHYPNSDYPPVSVSGSALTAQNYYQPPTHNQYPQALPPSIPHQIPVINPFPSHAIHPQPPQPQPQLHLPPQPPIVATNSSTTPTAHPPTYFSPSALAALAEPAQAAAASTVALPLPDLSSVFEDLYSRFFINLPSSELASFDRILIQLEQAWWFYCDFYSDQHAKLPKFNLKNFCSQFFQFSTLLSKHLKKFDSVFTAFQSYLGSVPVCGVVLLTPDLSHCLLVRSFNKGSWGFPKGKIDEAETELQCAIREAAEEIGFDCSQLIDENEFIEANNSKGKQIKLFIVYHGVTLQTPFQTQTRKEIESIEWGNIEQISRALNGDANKSQYWNVRPFLEPLKRWIKRFREGKTGGIKNSNKTREQKNKKNTKPNSAVNGNAKKSNNNNNNHNNNNNNNQSKNNNPHFNSAVDSVTFGSVVGWSPEQMFEVNEKLYGVKSSVPEEILEVPANIDEILEKVLGKKSAKGKPAAANNSAVKPGKKGSSAHSFSPNSNQNSNQTKNSNPNSAQKSKSRGPKSAHEAAAVAVRPPIAELDFCHDPLTVAKIIKKPAQHNSNNNTTNNSKPAPSVSSTSSTATADSADSADGFNFAAFAAAVQPLN